ncbi:hypothetical protein HY640_01990 [Candidatus Woesearchaeota archaeon]|nr:hypothetical protein [Candidatus Woesearchaeota archaeon]
MTSNGKISAAPVVRRPHFEVRVYGGSGISLVHPNGGMVLGASMVGVNDYITRLVTANPDSSVRIVSYGLGSGLEERIESNLYALPEPHINRICDGTLVAGGIQYKHY